MIRDMTSAWDIIDHQSLADEAALIRALIAEAGLSAVPASPLRAPIWSAASAHR